MKEHDHQKQCAELSKEEWRSLGKRNAAGDLEARETLILSHMNLVSKILPLYRGQGVDDEDLFQEGCYGLIEAVDRYDPDRGALLSTYASYWIKKRMSEAVIRQTVNRPMTIEPKLYYALKNYRKCYYILQEELGHPPTTAQVGERLGIPETKAVKLSSLFYTYTSLDAPIKHKDEWNEIPLTPTEKVYPSAEEEMFRHLTDIFDHEVLLTKREHMALCHHLGFTPSGIPETFAEISLKTSWSTETVRRDYYTALEKVKAAIMMAG